mmetsp:Transcript_70141/g.195123  ORF Transcript_70141/g.195123 Transcript_70141/m.195123 type:complete len:702 (+) Transcript_70141:44-2149(+)
MDDEEAAFVRPLLGGELPTEPPKWLRWVTWTQVYIACAVFLCIRLYFVHALFKLYAMIMMMLLAPLFLILPIAIPVLVPDQALRGQDRRIVWVGCLCAEALGMHFVLQGAGIDVFSTVGREKLRDASRAFVAIVEMLPSLLAISLRTRRLPDAWPPWRDIFFSVLFWIETMLVVGRALIGTCCRRMKLTSTWLFNQFLFVSMLLIGTSEPGIAAIACVWDISLEIPKAVMACFGRRASHLHADALVGACIITLLVLLKCLLESQKRIFHKLHMLRASKDIRSRIAFSEEKPFFAHILLGNNNNMVQTFKASFAAHAPVAIGGVEVEAKRMALLIKRRTALRGLCPAVLRVEVSRLTLLQDSLKFLAELPTICLLASKIEVAYIGEPGIDAGGLRRDWFDGLGKALVKAADSPDGHFCYAPDSTICPRPGERRFRDLFAIGRLLGLAIWFEIPVPIPLNPVACKCILQEAIGVRDLRRIDPEMYKYRVAELMKRGGAQRMENILGEPLYFMSIETPLRQAKELCEGGRSKAVTDDNKHEYMALLCDEYLTGSMREQIRVILEGIWDIIPPEDFQAAQVSFREVVVLIAGFDELDVKSWERHTKFSGSSRAQRWFWDVVSGFTPQERAVLLHFATGSSRLPSAGFSALHPPFKVVVDDAEDVNNLPHAHTCANQLHFPRYASKEELRKKLLIAITSDAGFGFA